MKAEQETHVGRARNSWRPHVPHLCAIGLIKVLRERPKNKKLLITKWFNDFNAFKKTFLRKIDQFCFLYILLKFD